MSDFQLTNELIKKLRSITGCSISDCKDALEYGNGDLDTAIAYLKSKYTAVRTPNLSFSERIDFMKNKKE